MQLPNFDENFTNIPNAADITGLEEAFAVFERVEEHLLDDSLLLAAYAH